MWQSKRLQSGWRLGALRADDLATVQDKVLADSNDWPDLLSDEKRQRWRGFCWRQSSATICARKWRSGVALIKMLPFCLLILLPSNQVSYFILYVFLLKCNLERTFMSGGVYRGGAPDMTEEQIERPSPGSVGVALAHLGDRASSCILSG